MNDLAGRMADTREAMRRVDISDEEINRRAREFERKSHERRQAKLQPARDKRAKAKVDHQNLISALQGCRDALLSVPKRTRSGDMERQIKRAEAALAAVGK